MVRTVVAWTTTLALCSVSTEGRAESPPSTSGRAAVLRVGVLREAGTPWDVAADGASGQCAVAGQSIQCPALSGPVSFRFAGRPGFVLTDGRSEGVIEVAPGESRSAWVLVPESERTEQRARLAPTAVTAADVLDQFVRTSDHEPAPPSWGQLHDLFALAGHRDVKVRRALPDALVPWWRHTASDPMSLGSPPLVPADLVRALGADPDLVVRRKLASRLRDLREPGEELETAANEVLAGLSASGGSVQRAAMGAVASRTREDAAPAPLETWRKAMVGMREPGPAGRAAVTALAALAGELEPGPQVDPAEAVELCLAHHPEKTWSLWNAWRDDVPFDLDRATRLVRGTVGWSPALLRHWSRSDPAGLRELFERWEPGSPHSDRWTSMVRGLGAVEDPALHALVERADNLSPPAPPADGG